MGQYTVDSIPGICATNNRTEVKPVLHVASTWEIDEIPADTAGVISGDITMVAAASPLPAGKFHPWELAHTPGKNSYKFEHQGDDDGGVILHTYVAVLNKITAARLQASKGGCNHVLLFHDNNEQVFLMGDKENGCTMTRGGEIAGTNNITVTFKWFTGKDVLEYTGAIPE